AQGTGTPVGDPLEAAALTNAYRQFTDKTGFCKIGSVKSNIGHLDTAAGVAGFIKVALAMQHGQIPPSLNFKRPNPACHFDTSPFVVNDQLSPWPNEDHPRRAGISALGVGGTNAHVILQEAPAPVPSSASRAWQLLPLSAKSSSTLQRTTANLTDYLTGRPDLDLSEVGYTLQVGRSAMPHRSIVVAKSVTDAVEAFEDPEAGHVFSGEAPTNGRSVAFMFAGSGLYPNMGAELYRDEPVYHEAVDECLGLLGSMVDYDLKSLLFSAPGHEADAARQLERPSITLPALFTTQCAQTKLWTSWGVEPAAMIGHSMGEYTAAHFAGVFDLRDTLALVLLRGQLFERVPEGGMLSVPLGAEALEAIMDERLSIAAINSPEWSVASGPVEAIEQLEATLSERDIDSVGVSLSMAAHSMMLDGILDEFEAFFQNITLSPPQIPFMSNLSGTWITNEEATDPHYWVQHLRNTVRFADGVAELFAKGHVLLEVGPGRTLATLAHQSSGRPEGVEPLNSMRHPDDDISDQAFMLTALGRLWLAGAPVDWSALHGTALPRRVPLPVYPFERQRHWVEPGSQAISVQTVEDHDPLAKRTDVRQWTYQPVWHRAPFEHTRPDGQSSIRALICGGPDALAAALEDRLVGEGHEVLRVHRSGRYAEEPSGSIRLDPSQADHWNRLVSDLSTSGRIPQWIYYLWPTTGEAASAGDIEGTLETSFYGPLYLAQALGNEAIDDEIRLAFVSNRVYRVAGESVLEPAKATLLGPCRVIPREFPNITCVHADVEFPQGAVWKTAYLAEQLVRELGTGAGEEVVAYRGMDRWVQRFDEVTLAEDGPGRLRDQGVYLITGGLGGIGLTLAEHLARTRQARLVLLGRTGLPPREEWDDWITRHGHDDVVSRKIDGIHAVEAAGGEVLTLSVDITDSAAMREAVVQATKRFGTLHGVFHAAGVLEDGVIQLKEPEVAARVLAPKVLGTVALDAALADVPVDFVMLFSSVSSFAGLAGQVDHTAATAFLDAWAHHQLAVGGPPTVAVNWGVWRDVGMAADMARQLGIAQDHQHESTGTTVEDGVTSPGEVESRRPRSTANNILSVSLEAGIRPAEGMTALEMVLSHAAVSQTVVSTQRLDALIDLLRTPVTPEASTSRRPSAEPRRTLSPVEVALAEYEGVAEAAAREFEERPGDWRLIAYVVYHPTDNGNESELRRYI
ncbi:MAG: type I polyketide synthase, partial [Gemmatimonadetes bacterium]|nr:type I polyketide synthase [Gemmatimonadota bacterium]